MSKENPLIDERYFHIIFISLLYQTSFHLIASIETRGLPEDINWIIDDTIEFYGLENFGTDYSIALTEERL